MEKKIIYLVVISLMISTFLMGCGVSEGITDEKIKVASTVVPKA